MPQTKRSPLVVLVCLAEGRTIAPSGQERAFWNSIKFSISVLRPSAFTLYPGDYLRVNYRARFTAPTIRWLYRDWIHDCSSEAITENLPGGPRLRRQQLPRQAGAAPLPRGHGVAIAHGDGPCGRVPYVWGIPRVERR